MIESIAITIALASLVGMISYGLSDHTKIRIPASKINDLNELKNINSMICAFRASVLHFIS